MNVTYIHHSCFSVETDQVVLIFDYYKGVLPEFDKSKQVFVFSSHKHKDHFDLKIFDLPKQYPNITYILSNDIPRNDSYLEPNHIPEVNRQHIHYIGENNQISFPLMTQDDNVTKDSLTASSLIVETLTSTDEGVAFLITLNNKVIYHAGDLNWWSWKGETKEEYVDMKDRFQKEMSKIKGRKIDVAFVPLDPRQEDRFWWGLDYYMKTTDTNLVFPMHFWKNYKVIPKLKHLEEAKEYSHKVMDINEEGQKFLI